MKIVVEVHQVKKIFNGVHALDGISFSLHEGEILGIVGPNGSGKTTLFNVLNGLTSLDSGSVSIYGQKYKRITPQDMYKNNIARTFQMPRLWGQMSVEDHILLSLQSRKLINNLWSDSDTMLSAATNILQSFGLFHLRNSSAENLSYGQSKLLEIAKSQAWNPRIYFFDEPFAGLFQEMKLKVQDIINSLKNTGNSVIIVEHDMDRVRALASRLIVLDAGRIIAEGKPSDVLQQKEVLEAYLGV